ncbi:hypothetical protein [Agrobacterium sp. LAD9]|uniref:hypothetical protein n=1 Tax=Agrobacterium sp. LAD9 TaxID=2055153 RepID=UPI0012908788|nr:hypothetical protein [Agrobacterium sp. LAD9]
METCDGLIVVWMNVAAQHDEELNDWYEGEHVAEVAGINRIHNVQRFFDASHPLRFMAMFECADEFVETEAGFQAMVENATPWTRRIRKLFGEQRRRGNYRRLKVEGDAKAPAALLVVQAQDAPAESAFERVRPLGCLRYRAFAQMPPANSFRPENRYLEVYDFDSVAAAEAARSQPTFDTRADISVRTSIGTPKFASR